MNHYPKALINCFLLALFVSLALSCSKEPNEEIDPGGDTGGGYVPDIVEPLPKIRVNMNGRTIVDEPKVEGWIEVIENQRVTYTGSVGIEIRGASSQMFPKKSYGFETHDESGLDLDVSLIGLPEEEDWILYGPYTDKSLVRNVLMYDLSRAMERYASRCRFIELTIDSDYKGVYVLMEKLKRDKNRIDISKLNPDENSGEDLTGGYILKIDKTAGSNYGSGINPLNSFPSKHVAPNTSAFPNFQYEYPKAEEITDAQKNYIQTFMEAFENALASSAFRDPIQGYQNFIDVDSFIDFFIMNELSNNVDGYRLSTYMHKDKNGKLVMGPIWDFNLAFGNADYCAGGRTDVWAYRFNYRCGGDRWNVPFWWERLLEDPDYVVRLKNRWNALRGGPLATDNILEIIGAYTDRLNETDASTKNFNIWDVLGRYIWPNNYVGNTYQDELDYLTDWMVDRLQWLDNSIQQL
jgi:hypothetical protein